MTDRTVAAGGWGVHVPHDLTWEIEAQAAPHGAERYRSLDDLGGLAELVAQIGWWSRGCRRESRGQSG